MPLRSLLLMMCCQNPKIEDDLESLNIFIKNLRDSVQGMRASLSTLQSSAIDFQQAMENLEKNKKNNNNFSQPFEEKQDNSFEEENIDKQSTDEVAENKINTEQN